MLRPNLIDLGECESGDVKSLGILIDNQSDESIYLRKVQPTCGCITSASASSKAIMPPHTSHAVDLALSIPSESGRFSKDILFFVDVSGSLKMLKANICGTARSRLKSTESGE